MIFPLDSTNGSTSPKPSHVVFICLSASFTSVDIISHMARERGEQVFGLEKYYSDVMRNWKRGTKILLALKAQEGDSFLGYGVANKVELLGR